jgi:predicted outer membrane repeat protein
MVATAALVGCGSSDDGSGDPGTGSGGGLVNASPDIVAFIPVSTSLDLNQPTSIDIRVADINGDPVTCELDTNGDGSFDETIQNCDFASHTVSFSSPGTYTLTLKVSDGQDSDTETVTITVSDTVHTPNSVPTITQFERVDTSLVYADRPFSLNIQGYDADDEPLTCTLDTNNDGTADQTIANCESSQTASVTLSDVASHTIGLSITDGEDTVSDTLSIDVLAIGANIPPTIAQFALASTATIYEDQSFSVVFRSEDMENSDLTCQLDVDGNGSFDQTIVDCQNTKSVNLSLSDAGGYTLNLSATDGVSTVTKTLDVTVEASTSGELPEIVSFKLLTPPPIRPNQTVEFEAVGRDIDSGIRCNLDADGDGNRDRYDTSCTAEGNKLTTSYDGVGFYTATLEVEERDGLYRTTTLALPVTVVSNKDPVLNSVVVANSSNIRPNQAVTFTWDVTDPENDDLNCYIDQESNGTKDNSNYLSCDEAYIAYSSVGTYTATLKVLDAFGGESAQQTLSIDVVDNSVPIITSLAFEKTSIRENEAVTLNWDISDADGDELTCDVDANGDGYYGSSYYGDFTVEDCANTNSTELTFSAAGDMNFNIRVRDSFSAEATTTASLTVTENADPQISGFKLNNMPVKSGEAAIFNVAVSDDDGDDLTCTLDLNADGEFETDLGSCGAAADYSITSLGAGVFDVALKVTDAYLGESTQTLKVAFYGHEFTVDTAEDKRGIEVDSGNCTTLSSNCSLRAAIMVANYIHTDTGAPSIINLPAGTFTLSLPEQQAADDNSLGGDLDVQGNVYIRGASAETTIIDGADTFRIFEVLDTASVSAFEKMTLQNGMVSEGSGGALYITSGDLYLLNTEIKSSSVDSDESGGAFYVNNGDVWLTNVTIDDNFSGGSVVVVVGSSYLTNSKITNNVSVTNRAFYAEGPVFIESSEFSGNTGQKGAALYLNNESSTWSKISGTTFKHNQALSTIGSVYGAAIYIANGNVDIEESIFEDNQSTYSGASYSRHGYGGSIYMNVDSFGEYRDGKWVSIWDSVKVTNSQFISNSASHGGAIYIVDGYMDVIESTFTSNSAVGTNRDGGAIYNGYHLDVLNSSFESNSAVNVGGAIASTDSSTTNILESAFNGNIAAFGGAVYSADVLKVTNSLLTNNEASSNGGAIYFQNSNADEALVLNFTTLINNSAVGDGGAIYEANTSSSAAAVYLKGTILQGNTAATGSNCFGTMISSGYNLIESEESCVAALKLSDSIEAVTLVEDTDETTGMAIASLPDGDSRINSIPAAECTNVNDELIEVDQLGTTRPQGAGCEPGALELVE